MPWVKLDDGFPEHPKVVQAGPTAGWLYVCGLAYCARQLTDGFIPAAQLRRLLPSATVRKLADRLVDVRLWETADGGFRVHDYLLYNPTRQQTLDLRRQKADAGRKGGKQKPSTEPSTTQAECLPSASPPVPVPVPVPSVDSSSSEPGVRQKDTLGVPGAIARAREAALVPVNGSGGSPQHALLAVAKIAFGYGGQTESERRKENIAAGELAKAGVTADELQVLILEHRRRGWPNPSLKAIAANLGSLRAPYEAGRPVEAAAPTKRQNAYAAIRAATAELEQEGA